MAKKKARRKSNGFTIPLTIALPLVNSGVRMITEAKQSGAQVAVENQIGYWTGFNPRVGDFRGWSRMQKGIGLMLVGGVAHKVAGKLGINRAIAGAGIPFIRV